MKNKLNIAILASTILLLTGCASNEKPLEIAASSSNEQISKTSPVKVESPDKSSDEFKKMLDEYSSEVVIENLGVITPTGFGYSDELGIDGTDKDLIPYNYVDDEFSENIDLYIESVSLAKLKLDESGMAFFNQSGPLQIVMVNMHITNKSDSEAIYLPSMIKLIVSEKEVFAEPSLTEDNNDLLNPIIPGGSVNGSVAFVFTETVIPDLVSLDLSQFFVSTPVGKEQLIDFNILDVEESIIKDNY